jgi:uncharacterized protein YbcV (DUF1398 family)
MAVYKIFPYKDATIYSYYPVMNAGIDAISEIYNSITLDGSPEVSRFLTQFDSTEIIYTINNKISGSVWTVNYKSFVATAQGIAAEYTTETFPLAQNWDNGTATFRSLDKITQ